MRTIIFTLLAIFSCTMGLTAQPYLVGAGFNAFQNEPYDQGSIYLVNAKTGDHRTLLSFFDVDGSWPYQMVRGNDGKFYGTAPLEGDFNMGVIFSYDPKTALYTKLHDFTGSTGGGVPTGILIISADNKLYGTAYGGNANYGVLFSFDLATNLYSVLYYNTSPMLVNGEIGGIMVANNGKIYGTGRGSGANGGGAIFSFDPLTNSYAELYSFGSYPDSSTDGSFPSSQIIQHSDGKLYGTTTIGGKYGSGVIFSFDIFTNSYTKIHDFIHEDGSNPISRLTEGRNGKLYGTTPRGGAHNAGVLFSFDLSNNTFNKEHDFSGEDGFEPATELVLASDGKLYGTTSTGGSEFQTSPHQGFGVIFSFDPATSTFTRIVDVSETYASGFSPLPSSSSSLIEIQVPPPVIKLKDFVRTAFTKEGKLVGIIAENGFNKMYRYNTDGTPDLAFGTAGVATIDKTGDDNGTPLNRDDDFQNRLISVAVDDLGRILVSEVVDYRLAFSYFSLTLSRFNPDGTPDDSFGLPYFGRSRMSVGGGGQGFYDYLGPIGIQKDNKAVVARSSWSNWDFSSFFRISRLLESGLTDFEIHSFLPQNYLPVGIALQDNGKILIESALGNSSEDSVMLVRLNSDSTYDQSFGAGGVVKHALAVKASQNQFAYKSWELLTVQKDGKIIIATSDQKLVRLKDNGSIDSTFGINGVVDPAMAVGRLVPGSDNKLYVGGSQNGDFALARFLNSGAPDPSFGNAGIIIIDFGGQDTIQNMTIVGKTLYAYGTRILTSYQLNSCTPPTFIDNNTIVLDASCGKNDGNISIIPTSGTPPFQYSIDGAATYKSGPDKGFTFRNLAKGTYQLRLKDANDCESAIVTKEVKEVYNCPPVCTAPTFLNSPAIVLDASCGKNDGNISIIPISGTAPFKYSIDGGTTYVNGPATGYTFENLAGGTYQLRLKDATSCESAIITKQVKANAYGPCVTVKANGNSITMKNEREGIARIFPNPSTGKFRVEFSNVNTPIVQLTVLTAKGVVVQQTLINSRQSNTVEVDLSGKPKGIYIVRLVAETGSQVSKVIIQ